MSQIINCPITGKPAQVLLKFNDFEVYYSETIDHPFSVNITKSQEDIYNPQYFTDKHKNWFNHPDLKLFDWMANQIDSKKGKNASIMDVGCGNGNFLSYLATKGFDNLHGLDIVDVRRDQAGYNFHCEDIYTFTPTVKYDVIVSMMNIEHVNDPNGYVKILASLVKDDGLIIINTINSDSNYYKIGKALFSSGITFIAKRLFDPHHLNHFSETSLKYVFENQGWNRIKILKKDYPIKAVDIDQKNPLAKGILYSGIFILDVVNNLTNGPISQTVLFERK
jgi:2-polyprenyl-3-methyl-5-hydroxy-6-metoxy-1,4-benzoquinol methylase